MDGRIEHKALELIKNKRVDVFVLTHPHCESVDYYNYDMRPELRLTQKEFVFLKKVFNRI